MTFSAFDCAVLVAEISPAVCIGSVGCAAAFLRNFSCSSAVRRAARSRSSSARRFWRSAVSLLRGSSTDQHSHVFITSPRIRRKLVRENIKLLGSANSWRRIAGITLIGRCRRRKCPSCFNAIKRPKMLPTPLPVIEPVSDTRARNGNFRCRDRGTKWAHSARLHEQRPR